MIPRPPISTLFPYTTLFRSNDFAKSTAGQISSAAGKIRREGKQRGRRPGELNAISMRSVGHALKQDRKSTRLNSSHPSISYAVFCLKKKTKPPFASFTILQL